MANKRIKDLSTTAAVTASDDFIAVDGATNGTRKLDAYSPTFGGNLTVSGGTIGTAAATNLTLNGGSTGASLVLGQGATAANATILPKGTGSIGLATSSATLYGKVATALATATSPATIASASFDATYATFGGVTAASGSTFGIGVTSGGTSGTNLVSLAAGSDWLDINYYGLNHKFYSFGAEKSRFTSTGNLLLGTTTDSGNGKLQLATHTTSAGGIGFGTALSMYRSSDNSAWIDAASGNVQLILGRAGTANLAVLSDGSNVYASAAQVGMGMILRTNGGTAALTLDSSQNATFAGKITANGAGSTFKGTATNDSAAAGYVGEYVSSTVVQGSAVSLTTATTTGVTSISLTAGDWDIDGNVNFIPQTTTVRTRAIACIFNSVGLPATDQYSAVTYGTADASANIFTVQAVKTRYSLSATTTIYLTTYADFSAGTLSAFGSIRARRVR